MALQAAIGEDSAPYTQGGKQRPRGMVTLDSLVLCAPLLLKYTLPVLSHKPSEDAIWQQMDRL